MKSPQGVPATYEFDVTKLHGVTTPRAAIETDDGVPRPCVAISVGTTGMFNITAPDGTVVGVPLAAGVLHYISTSVLPTGAGVIIVWY
jgi:hypothetical protein